MGSKFSCMIKEAKVLGMALGIPCFKWDGCFTSDSDIFLFGARTVYRDICLGDGSYVTCYEMTEVERRLGFGRNSLEVSIIHKGLLLNILFNVPNFSRYALSFLSDLLRKQSQ